VFPRGKRCCETIIFLEAKTGFATSHHHGPILASAAVALLYIFVLFRQFPSLSLSFLRHPRAESTLSAWLMSVYCLGWQPSQFINIVGKDDFIQQFFSLAGLIWEVV
jgi:hypothetical protein